MRPHDAGLHSARSRFASVSPAPPNAPTRKKLRRVTRSQNGSRSAGPKMVSMARAAGCGVKRTIIL